MGKQHKGLRKYFPREVFELQHTLSRDLEEFLSEAREIGMVRSALKCIGHEDYLAIDSAKAKVILSSKITEIEKELDDPTYVYESTAFHADPQKSATKAVEKGYLSQGIRIRIEPPEEWGLIAKFSRNVRYKIQAWIVLDAPLYAHSQGKGEEFLDPCILHVNDWIDSFIRNGEKEDFAWYDMAVGQRATKLSYALRMMMKNGDSIEDLAAAIVSTHVHLQELMREEKIASHSNHGLFQMVGLLTIGKTLPFLPESAEAVDFSTKKIREMVSLHFSSDFLHKEHSPMYHVFMTNYLSILLDTGMISEIKDLVVTAEGAVEAASWLSQPDGTIIPFGDTPNITTQERANFKLYKENGRVCSPEGLRVFPEGGMIIHSSYDSYGYASNFLAFNGSFHSRQHKHADDFTFQLCSGGNGIITDPGTFTYQYDLPERMYIESTRAHNCLLIDGMNYSRFKSDVFGSSIEQVHEIGDLVMIEAFVKRGRLVDERIPNNQVKTKHGVRVRIDHRRILLYHPGKFLVTIDDVESEEERSYSQCFQLFPEINVMQEEEMSILSKFIDGEYRAIATMIPLTSGLRISEVKGQTDPFLWGWVSSNGHELEEASNVQFSTKGGNELIASVIDMSPEEQAKSKLSISGDGKYLKYWRKGEVDSIFELRQKGARQLLTYNHGKSCNEVIVE